MTKLFSAHLQSGRLVAIALVVGGSALAAPAFAESGASFSFGVHTPGGDVRMGVGPDHGPRHFRRACLNDDDIANELEDAGWRRVEIGADLGPAMVVAFGSWGHRPYQMTVDRCTGDVGHVRPLRQDRPDFGGDNGDFGHRPPGLGHGENDGWHPGNPDFRN
jgi:hypothetical protein